MKYKQVIVVRKDIPMSAGKMAGQVAHASISSVLNYIGYGGQDEVDLIFDEWFKDGHEQKKVILQIKTLAKLENLMKKADDMKIPYFAVRDAGLTEIPPNTLTCIGFVPMTDEQIDPLTKKLSVWK